MEQKPISLESEAGFRVLFRCATVSILVVNERGNIELANPCAEALFGYQPAELIGKAVETLIPEKLRSKHTQYRNNYFEMPKTRPMGRGLELYARKKTGEVFPVEISLGHYELEGEKLAVAFITDITYQVNAKKLLAEREAWFRNMADNSPVMIWVAGVDKNCTYFNNTWLEFTGRRTEEEIGSGWISGIHLHDLKQYLVMFNKAFDTKSPFDMEFRLLRHDGEYRWVQCTGKPTYVNSTFTGLIGSCTDVHDQRMITEELEKLVRKRTVELSQALDREKEMNELKSRFVSMASHEFRTPLSIVLSSASLVEQHSGTGLDEQSRKHLNRIRASVNNLTNILNDFLSLDKLEQGIVEIEAEIFDLSNFLEELLDDVQAYKKKEQKVKFIHNGERNVSLDKNKLRYIIINLLSNAMKYSADGKEISITSTCAANEITIAVKDKGIGIPAEDQERMYGKFFRAKNTGHIQGTGLGLTIVKRYVELMEGSIDFVSQAGEGTTFTLRFHNSP